MVSLESGKDKIKQICDELRRETLEPALSEAEKIIQEAHATREKILHEARREAEAYHHQAKKEIEQDRAIFESSLDQAVKQSIAALKQSVEKHLFNTQLEALVASQVVDPAVIGKLIDAIIQAIHKEGLKADISAIIPQTVSASAVNVLLMKQTLEQLRHKSVELGDFHAGAKVTLHNRQLTIDMSDEALRELLLRYVRKDYRQLLFQE